MYSIYTEKFGMISAMAQGVRLLKSKLRYNLDLFTYGNFAVVRGKDIWRITDTEGIKKINNNHNYDNLFVFARIAGFLLRMIKGEERNNFIWSEIKNLYFNLNSESEILTIARILHNLGYMAEIPKSKKEMITAINKAIKESML